MERPLRHLILRIACAAVPVVFWAGHAVLLMLYHTKTGAVLWDAAAFLLIAGTGAVVALVDPGPRWTGTHLAAALVSGILSFPLAVFVAAGMTGDQELLAGPTSAVLPASVVGVYVIVFPAGWVLLGRRRPAGRPPEPGPK
ncbi:MAG: hypothetical protein ACLFVU_07885 [Phycisphaerae bacterium]